MLEAAISCATRCTSSLLSGMAVSRLFDLVTFGPVVLHMLYKLAVPGRMRLVAVLPVYDELRQQGAGKFSVDVRQAQDIKDILGRLPLLGDAFGLGAVLQAGGVFGPLDANMLDKL